MKFTIDTFENNVPHFLDIEICPDGLGIYHKHTQTGQYVHITSYTLWRSKTSWIRSLAIRAKKICSANYFYDEIKLIKRYAAWNGYPRNVVNVVNASVCVQTEVRVSNHNYIAHYNFGVGSEGCQQNSCFGGSPKIVPLASPFWLVDCLFSLLQTITFYGWETANSHQNIFTRNCKQFIVCCLTNPSIKCSIPFWLDFHYDK